MLSHAVTVPILLVGVSFTLQSTFGAIYLIMWLVRPMTMTCTLSWEEYADIFLALILSPNLLWTSDWPIRMSHIVHCCPCLSLALCHLMDYCSPQHFLWKNRYRAVFDKVTDTAWQFHSESPMACSVCWTNSVLLQHGASFLARSKFLDNIFCLSWWKDDIQKMKNDKEKNL